ncbi:inositol monophosphatase [Qipengyuania sp. 6B39]|uniref:inositol monophosphatase family protein n=1 Tax=Qipengyuania proteolytica TaxID=2867239 RepID=UPI001C89FB08|nr:inositol monophosphatase family protein [Qipengyuania proteolytica]MBX7495872.1 inositol monophosphatase [Qipengyuania proteolytica]
MQRVSEQAILPRFRNLSGGEIIEKAEDDLVTIADREAETMLAEGLAQIDPSLTIVGEEAAHADPSVLEYLSGDCWIIDPIDGTHNFAHGRAPFGILLARAAGGIARSGWIYDCVSGRFCSAHRGGGAFVEGQRAVSRPTGETPPVAAISVIFLDPARREQVAEHIAPHYRTVETPRCAAEQYPRLALGQNDVSFFERTLAWDHAAGALWLEEACGRIARPDGSAYRVDEWDRPGLIGAASPALWDELAELYAKLD